MTDAQFSAQMEKFVAKIREMTPRDTGNLRLNATTGYPESSSSWVISVNQQKAPYFKYVNNRARLSNGAMNRNYKYFQDAVEIAIEELAQAVGGVIVRV